MNPGGMAIVVLLVGAFAALIGYIVSKDRERSRAREQRATERGWTYTRGGGRGRHYSVQGTEGGTPWTLSVYQGGKHKTARTAWSAPDPPLPGGAVFVGSRPLAAFLKNPLGNRLARWGFRIGAGGEDVKEAWAKLMEGHQEVESGDRAFDENWAVLATDPGQARRLVNGEACRAMLEWEEGHRVGRLSRGSLTVTWWDGGLLLTWEGAAVESPDDMVGFADLGLGLRSSCLKSW